MRACVREGAYVSVSTPPTPTPHTSTHTRPQTQPNMLKRHVVVTSLAAGHRHVLLVTADGTVLAAGANAQGQLGMPGMCVRGFLLSLFLSLSGTGTCVRGVLFLLSLSLYVFMLGGRGPPFPYIHTHTHT